MSRELAVKIFAPLAVGASILAGAFMMSSAPPPVSAGDSDPAGAVRALPASLPMQAGMPSLAPMLKNVMPAVVNIAVTSKQQIQNQLAPFMDDPFFRRFFGIPEQQVPREREAQSVGSGVIVDAAKGYVLTNNHVIEQADSIKVRLSDDREFDAELVGKDPETDLAVLKIKADKLTALTIGNSDQLQVGDFVVAIGSPFNLRQTVTSGIVSALGRSGIGDGYEDFIQTDASINPGNSGGALVNLRGELVGINSMILSRTGGNIGIGFAIPTNLAKNIMTQLIENGAVERGRIGIFGQDINSDLAKAFKLPSNKGAIVTKVVPKSPADDAGVKSEDVVTRVNGKEIEGFAQLRNIVGLMRVGEKVELEIIRDGKPKKLTVTIGKNVDAALTGAGLHPRLQGATFAPVDERDAAETGGRGVKVTRIDPRSVAARNGLREGDIIIGVNRRAVENMEDFQKLAGERQGQLLLHLRRGQGALFLLIE
jgi:Do/DeqQ family serine protease